MAHALTLISCFQLQLKLANRGIVICLYSLVVYRKRKDSANIAKQRIYCVDTFGHNKHPVNN